MHAIFSSVAALWVLLALAALPQPSVSQCLLGLEVTQQSIVLSGSTTTPLVQPILVTDSASFSLAGRLYLELQGACPEADGAVGQSGTLVSPAGSGPLTLSPPTISAKVGAAALATLQIKGMQFNLTSGSQPVQLGPTAAAATLFADIVNGTVAVNTALAGSAPKPAELAGTLANSSALLALQNEAGALQLQISGLNLTFASSFTLAGIQGNAVYFLAGNLTATAALGCADGCGVDGVCSSADGKPFCQCDCGWTGATCSNPSASATCAPASAPGLATALPPPRSEPILAPAPLLASGLSPSFSPAIAPSLYGSQPHIVGAVGASPKPSAGSGDKVPPPPPNQGPQSPLALTGASLGGQAQSAVAPLTCNNGQDSSCASCQSGWNGPNCDVCLNNDVCNAELHVTDATCNKSAIYSSQTAFKSYSCNITGTVLATVLEPERGFFLACNTTAIVDSAGRQGGYCQVGLRVQSASDNPGTCIVTGCAFQEGESSFQCHNATCSCAKGTCESDVQSYVDLINGKDVEAECDASNVCTVKIADFPIQVQLPCTFGDCQSPNNPQLFSGRAASTPRNYAAAVAAVPLMILVLLGLCALASSSAMLTAWRTQRLPKGSLSAEVAGLENGGLPTIKVLRFERISCTVAGSRFAADRIASQSGSALATPSLTPRKNQHTNGLSRPGLKDPEMQARADANTASCLPAPIDRPANGTLSTVQQQTFKSPLAHAQSDAALLASGWMEDANGALDHEAPPAEHDTWRRRALSLLRPRPRLTILREVSGEARLGELVGVLGPSGSGKTTLLSILADSMTSMSASSHVHGQVTLDGQPRERLQRGLVAYVPQSDYLLPTLTVRESIWYSAHLRLQAGSSPAAIQERVDRVLEELGLGDVAGTQVGGVSSIRGISGGERRRVTIGMELVTEPCCLVLDEPTSGLDSFTALQLMHSLSQVAHAGRIVLLSIHQPSPIMFAVLDRAYLMCRGQLAFSGRPASAEGYFRSAGVPCPEGTPVAEHMLTTVTDAGLRERILEHASRWGCSSAPEPEVSGEDGGKQTVTARASLPTQAPGRSFTTELAVLSWRTFVDIWRNWSLLAMHLGISLLMGVLCGAIFYRLSNDIAGAQGRLGAVFFTLCLSALTSLTTVDLLTNERSLVVRETQAGYYRPISYYLSKATLDGLLLRVLPAVVYAIPLYPMVRLQGGASHVALFFCASSVFAATIGAMSMALVVGFGTAGKASLVMNVFLLLQLLFAGYLVNVDSITAVLRWLHYLSAFYYGFESLVVNEISGLVFAFEAAGISANLNGDAFLNAVNINPKYLMRDVALLDALWAAFLCLGIVLLYITLPRKMRMRNADGVGL